VGGPGRRVAEVTASFVVRGVWGSLDRLPQNAPLRGELKCGFFFDLSSPRFGAGEERDEAGGEDEACADEEGELESLGCCVGDGRVARVEYRGRARGRER